MPKGRSRMRRLVAAGSLLGLAAAVTPVAASATTPAEPVAGGTLTYTHTLEPRSLDPVHGSFSSPQGDAPQFYALYDALVIEDPETAEVIPQLAESLTTEDGLVWTLTLRPDVMFTDGTPLDAEAVKYNTERHADPDNASQNLSVAQSIESMEVVGDLTLTYTLVEPNVEFDRIVARRLGHIASPTALEAEGENYSDNPVGAGPFVVEEWTRDSRMVFTRNPDYWNAPRPYIDELIIELNVDPGQRLNAFTTGQIDVTISSSNPELAAQAEAAGFTAAVLPSLVGGSQFQFNTTQPPFDDVRVRQAVHLAVDREALIESQFEGGDESAEHLIREPSPFYAEDQVFPAHDDDAAKALIDEYLADTGQDSLEFTMLHSPGTQRLTEFVQAELLALGNVDVSLEVGQGADMPGRLATGDFQMVTFSITALSPEPDLYDFLHTDGTRNYPGYSDPEMDEALEIGRSSLDPDERFAAYETVQRLVIRDMPALWLRANNQGYPIQDDVRDFALNGTSPLWDRVWLDQ